MGIGTDAVELVAQVEVRDKRVGAGWCRLWERGPACLLLQVQTQSASDVWYLVTDDDVGGFRRSLGASADKLATVFTFAFAELPDGNVHEYLRVLQHPEFSRTMTIPHSARTAICIAPRISRVWTGARRRS